MSDETKESNWKNIISVIDSPLKLLALIALIFNGILLYFAQKTRAEDSKELFLIALLVFVFLIVLLIIIYKSNIIPPLGSSESNRKINHYDFFIAAPMAAFSNNKEYQEYRNEIINIIQTIQSVSGLKNYFYAAKNILRMEDFELANLSVLNDMEAIRNSKYFIMIYLRKFDRPSSVVYEAGIALALGKKSIYFGLEDNFPFLMKDADNAFSHVKIIKASSSEDVITILKNNGPALFEM